MQSRVLAVMQNNWNKKERVYIRKELNSLRVGFAHEHAHRFLFFERQYGCHDSDVMCIQIISRHL